MEGKYWNGSSFGEIVDQDLTAIGGLAGTSGYLKKTAENTWTLESGSFVNTTDLKLGVAATGDDLNLCITDGIYFFSPSTANKPGGTDYGILHVMVSQGSTYNGSNNWIWQIAYHANSNSSWYRKKINAGAWDTWQRMLKIATVQEDGAFDNTTTAPAHTTRLNYDGYLYATKVFGAVFNDYAEYFEKGEKAEPGDIIAADQYFDRYVKSRFPYNNRVVGVVSDTYFQCIGGKGDGNDEENYYPIGVAGRVNVKVTGDVKKGDLIVTSDIPGVGMASDGYKPGTIVGKALGNHRGKSIDRIPILVMNI